MAGLPNPTEITKDVSEQEKIPVDAEPGESAVETSKEGSQAPKETQAPAKVEGESGASGSEARIPRERLNQEIKRRQEYEAKVKEYQAKEGRYNELDAMDKVMSAFVQKYPEKWAELKPLIAGQAEQKKEFVQAEAQAQQEYEQEGEVSPATQKMLRQLAAELKATKEKTESFISEFQGREQEQKEFEGLQKEKETFFAEEGNESFKGNDRFMNLAIDAAKSRGISLYDAMHELAEYSRGLSKKGQEEVFKKISENTNKQKVLPPSNSGAPAGAVDNKKKPAFDSEEHIAMIAESYQ